MPHRRIVTGHAQDGRSVFIEDGLASRDTAFKHVPGFATTLFWETKGQASLPSDSGDPAIIAKSWVPGPGGTNLMFVTFPPDSVMGSADFDPAEAGAEYMEVLPGLAECFEPDSPGMHTTDTVDYAVLLSGELHLELDDGASRKLGVHDVVVQQGTRHAWRNRSDVSATILFVLIGTRRALADL